MQDLNANITDFTTIHDEDQNFKRIRKTERFINKTDFDNKEKIEKKLDKNKWLKSLIDDQIKNESLLFRSDFEENISPKKNKRNKRRKIPYENITTQKRKQIMSITSEERLKELPSIYTKIPTDQTSKIEATKKIFDKIIKQVPDTPKKRINIQYNEKNNSYNIEEEWI